MPATVGRRAHSGLSKGSRLPLKTVLASRAKAEGDQWSSGYSGRSRRFATAARFRWAARSARVLALLLLHANEVVSRDRLIEALWADREPGTAGQASTSRSRDYARHRA